MARWEILGLWLICYFSGLVAFAARITYRLGIDPVPPEDPRLLPGWIARRRWLTISEFAALPFFSTLAVVSAALGWMTPEFAVGFALLTGALGFGFFLKALEAVLRDRYGVRGGTTE